MAACPRSSRLPSHTPKQMLYGLRGYIRGGSSARVETRAAPHRAGSLWRCRNPVVASSRAASPSLRWAGRSWTARSTPSMRTRTTSTATGARRSRTGSWTVGATRCMSTSRARRPLPRRGPRRPPRGRPGFFRGWKRWMPRERCTRSRRASTSSSGSTVQSRAARPGGRPAPARATRPRGPCSRASRARWPQACRIACSSRARRTRPRTC